MDEKHDECGIAAVFLKKANGITEFEQEFPNISSEHKAMLIMYKLLLNLQNRGQLSAGVTSYNDKRQQLLRRYRKLGSVNEAFKLSSKIKSKRIFTKYAGNKIIGHVRYATCGTEDVNFAQPFERQHGRKWKWFSFCFNGQIANFLELKKDLVEKGEYHLTRESDTEIIMHLISKQLNKDKKLSLVEVFSNLSKKIDGSWSIAFLNAKGDLVLARDPLGFKPLCYGEVGNLFLAASESNALLNCGATNIKYVNPGEMVLIRGDKIEIKRFAESKRKAHCMFEWVYFANVASTLDHRSVYMVRRDLGKELAKVEPEKVKVHEYIVVSVPDTAKSSADSIAFELGLQSKEGLMRNRYVGRTFIEGEKREDKVKNKYTALKEVLEGKKVILVDDSIVRGTTLKKLIKYLKKEGKAKEVHIRVSCPPIMAPCFYGIDMSTIAELFAPKFFYVKDMNNGTLPKEVLDKMAKELGADSIVYQSIGGLVKSIGLPKEDLCMACLNAQYPTKAGKKLYKIALDNFKKGIKNNRTYCPS